MRLVSGSKALDQRGKHRFRNGWVEPGQGTGGEEPMLKLGRVQEDMQHHHSAGRHLLSDLFFLLR
jgi:hypothetical protein